jgi:flavin-dependent dehydrogenase
MWHGNWSPLSNRIRHITIVGGGTAGWMSAVFLATRFGPVTGPQGMRVTLIESPNVPTVGVGEATVPAMTHWLKQMGIDEDEFFLRCNASFKLGVRFVNWDHDPDGRPRDYVHPFQGVTSEIRDINTGYYFHRFQNADGQADASDALTPCRAVINARRAPRGLVRDPKSDLRYAYHLDAGLFANLLKEKALERGVEYIQDDVDEVTLDGKGFVDTLTLRVRGRFPVELVVDCTGFKGLIIQEALGEPFDSYGKSLLCDRALAVQIPHTDVSKLDPFTQSTALGAGWSWRVPLYSRIGTGYVFSSAFRSDEEATEEFLRHLGPAAQGATPRALAMRVGRSRRTWVANCVAVGLSSGFIEPLESTAIYLIDRSLAYLAEYFPDRTFDPTLTRRYNKVVGEAYAEIRDFIVLHYRANNRSDTSFWKAARNDIEIPDSLEENLELWRRVLPSSKDIEHEFLFSYLSYIQVLFGKRYFDGTRFAVEELLRPGDWQAFTRAMDDLKVRLLQELPDHYQLVSQIRARAEGRVGARATHRPVGTTARPTVPLPGQAVQPQIRFSPGILAEANLL